MRDWTTNCEIHDLSLGVSTDAIQEHYYTGAKIVGSFYNNAEYSFLFMKNKNLNQSNEFKCQKVQIPMREVRSVTLSRTIHKDFKDCKTLNLTVTFLWQVCCITRFFCIEIRSLPDLTISWLKILIFSEKVWIAFKDSVNFWSIILCLWLRINDPSKFCMSQLYIVRNLSSIRKISTLLTKT